jgi:uncharacterized membrane protein YbhN (UPF0104 family)
VNRRWLRLLLGVVLGGGALWLATRAVDWAETGRALRSADISLLLAALLVQAASFLIVALRWRALFPTPGTVSVSRLVQVLLVAQLVNAAFPLRLGPVARAYLVGERDGQGTALALTTVAGEKLLEMLALALGIVLLLVLLPLPAWLRHAGLGAVLFAAGGLAAVLLVARGRRRIEGWLPRLGQWVTGVSLAMLDTMAAWLSPGRIGQLLGWTAILWAAGTGVNALVLLAFGLPAHSTTAIALLILLQLGARVPGAPANAGVFESLCIAGLGWFGVEPAQALSYGLALHAVVLLPGLVGGAWVLWRDSAVRAGLRQAANATASRTPGGQL